VSDPRASKEGKNKHWLSKEEWDKLDDLLGKHGFGGYYDLVQCLKGVLSKLRPELDQSQIKDLPTVVQALMRVPSKKS